MRAMTTLPTGAPLISRTAPAPSAPTTAAPSLFPVSPLASRPGDGATGRPTPIPTDHHARVQLAELEQLLLSLWTAAMPELDDARTARLCAAHRAVHEALLLLDDAGCVVADVGPYPGERG
jgi:hypothetical protein